MKFALCSFVLCVLWVECDFEAIWSPCPDVLTYTLKKPCVWKGSINLTSNLTYTDIYLVLKISTTLQQNSFMEYMIYKPTFQMKGFTSMKYSEVLGDIVIRLDKPKNVLNLSEDNPMAFSLDFGNNCHVRPVLESILLNEEEICFVKQREVVDLSFNRVEDCEDLQKIVKLNETGGKLTAIQLVTPVTVQGIWVAIELHEPYDLNFQKLQVQVKNHGNRTYEIYNRDYNYYKYYLPQYDSVYLTFDYNKNVGVKSIKFNGRLVCQNVRIRINFIGSTIASTTNVTVNS